jgi:hypothetical protein
VEQLRGDLLGHLSANLNLRNRTAKGTLEDSRIKERTEALDKFKIFKAEVENQHNLKIKIVRSDCGGATLMTNEE